MILFTRRLHSCPLLSCFVPACSLSLPLYLKMKQQSFTFCNWPPHKNPSAHGPRIHEKSR